MAYRHRRDHSLPHRNPAKEGLEEGRKSQLVHSPQSSRAESKQHLLKYDINTLLSLFNEMEEGGSGEVSRKGIMRILQVVGLFNHDHYLRADSYTFDHFLSVVGQIEVPNQPSVYVLSFLKILVHYRQRCLQNEEEGLEEAQAVQQKIKGISRNQIERQKQRIKLDHGKIYDQMQKSQEKQFISFQDQWKTYLKQFKEETFKRLQQTSFLKKSKAMEEEARYMNKIRKNNVITSPWLRQLTQKKKWLIHNKKFQEAIQVSNQINRQKIRLQEHKYEQKESILNKKLAKLNTKNDRYMTAIQKNFETDFNRLMSKKKQGQTIMRIRMKKLREEANKKLNEHYRTEMHRLRSSFYMVVHH